ncbi:MAG: hypothetical protein WB760_15055 [Xanthobacteraceae bacterium]
MHAIAYKEGRATSRQSRPRLLRVAAIGAFACTVALAVTAVSATAQNRETAVTCTNPYSGATWQIRIDYDRSTVDSNPARIDDATISWRDAKDGWRYTLDRKSGKLTVILASATGGNFLYDQCKLEN